MRYLINVRRMTVGEGSSFKHSVPQCRDAFTGRCMLVLGDVGHSLEGGDASL